MILLITNKEDAHPTPVIKLLHDRSIPVFRLNTEALLSDYEFNWRSDASGCYFYIRNLVNGLELHSNDITVVWERRPEIPSELPLHSLPEIDKHNLKEALGFLQFLRFYLKDIPSIGSIANDRTASSKMLQLQIARTIGLETPDTCFSNRKEDIVRFAEKYETVILKSIENDGVWLNGEQEYVFYARKVPSKLLKDQPEGAFSQTVSYVQDYIEKQYELRITVVGRDIFTCRIDSQLQDEKTGKVDWRQGYDYGLKHTACELPADIGTKCIEFLKRMGLNFGCFDFIVTPNGRYVFVECNPNGQWLWIEQLTGMKISESITSHLEFPNRLRVYSFE